MYRASLFALGGILIGVVLEILVPQLLDFALIYTANIQDSLGSSMVKGTSTAIAPLIIPIICGLIGFVIGRIFRKSDKEKEQKPFRY